MPHPSKLEAKNVNITNIVLYANILFVFVLDILAAQAKARTAKECE
jgi:hypothetical protein